MKAVGIKNLKNSLSKYLDMVREGEVIYVTDRDDIIAEIHKPVSAPTRLISRWEAFLNAEERKGSIQRAKHSGPSKIAEWATKLKPAKGLDEWKDLLDETREDRFR
jgi:antitoxin (DNA-binding transcriptional repressor) of toxin-antitoxin stability system